MLEVVARTRELLLYIKKVYRAHAFEVSNHQVLSRTTGQSEFRVRDVHRCGFVRVALNNIVLT